MKRKNKIFRKVIIVLAVLALLTGCAGQEPEAEDTRTPTDDNLIVVGVSQEGSESVWRTANTRSVLYRNPIIPTVNGRANIPSPHGLFSGTCPQLRRILAHSRWN